MPKITIPHEVESLALNMNKKQWRMANLYCIRNKAGQRIKFAPNNTQKQLFKSKSRFNATLKGRQQGVTTGYVINYLDDAMYNPNTNVAIISHKRDSIETIFRIARYAYKYIPDGLKPEIAKGGGSKYEMYFPATESRIYVSLEVRSDSVQRLHVSEYGLMKDTDKYDASVEAVPMDTGVISIESTPMGLNHFYDNWFDPHWGFKRHFFPWYFHYENVIPLTRGEKLVPTEDEIDLIEKAAKISNIKIRPQQLKWRRAKIQSKNIKSFLVEHPEDEQTCFLTSGDNVLDVQSIKEQLLSLRAPIKKVKSTEIYEAFNKTESYVVGADTSGGTGGDYYVGHLYRVSDWTQCAQVRGNKWRPKEFAEKLVEMCKLFSTSEKFPLLGVERNNHGHAVLLVLDEILHYPNLYYHDGYDDKLGWNTTSLTRPTLLDHFVEAVEAGILKLRSKELLAECLTLVDNNGKIEAQEGKHDDCIIGSAIAVQMLQKAKAHGLWDNLDSFIAVN